MGVSDSLAAYFDLEERGTDVRTEALAGLTTFLAMSYIILVNPIILSGAIDVEGYSSAEVTQMITVATILASVVAILVMALYADRPFGLAPGMGLNVFFATTVVVGLGVPWELALVSVFVEGIIFIALTAVGAREAVIRLFPEPVKFAVGAGIGIFLLFVGLDQIGIIVDEPPTGDIIGLTNVLTDPVAALALGGLALTFMLYARGVRGSIVLGIVVTGLVGWVLSIAGVVAPDVLAPSSSYDQIASDGLASTVASTQYDITPLISGFVDGFGMVAEDPLVFVLVVFTFFFVDFFDTAGTLIGVSQIGGFLDEDGDLPEMDRPLMADAVGTTFGAIVGTSTVTTYIESSTGVEEGGRTGLTALVVGLLFLASLLAVPLVSLVPSYATYVAVVVVGIIMLQGVADIDWQHPAWAIAGGLTIVTMPLTMSISNGLAAGIIVYPLVKTAVGERRDVSAGQWLLAAAVICYFIAYFAAAAEMIAF